MRPDRPHQTRALEEVSRLVGAGTRALLLQMPTGAGKTHVGLRAAEMAIAQGLQVVWFAHREELVKQPRDRILAEGWPAERLAVITGGRRAGLVDAPLTLCSIQSAAANPGLLPEGAGLAIFDEARHYVAKQWGQVASRFAGAYRIGLDATPQRSDGSPLGDLFDRIVVGASVAELTAAGHLVPSVIKAPSELQEDLAQDPIEAYREHTPRQRALVFCSSVPYAKNLAARFRSIGVTAEAIDAKSDEDARAGALRRFERGETRVICNVRILTEGTDLPATEAIIHASQCGSLADWIQKGGRGLRPSPETGKTRCTIVDLYGSFHLHGFLDDPHVYSLAGKGIALAEGLPPIAQCSKCFAWGRSARRCAVCGNVVPEPPPRAPKIRAADLQEQRRSDGDDRRRERLLRWATEARRGGSEGKSLWRIAHKYRGTYGEDPPRTWVLDAIEQSDRVLSEERRAQRAASEPLLSRMGGVE